MRSRSASVSGRASARLKEARQSQDAVFPFIADSTSAAITLPNAPAWTTPLSTLPSSLNVSLLNSTSPSQTLTSSEAPPDFSK